MGNKKFCCILVMAAVLSGFFVSRLWALDLTGYVTDYQNPEKHFSVHINQVPFPTQSVVHHQFNFHIVHPGIWRSALPPRSSIHLLKSYGLKTVLSLLTDEEERQVQEQSYVEDLSIAYIRIPLNAQRALAVEKLQEILEVMNDPKNQPILVHCLSGKERTGLVAALYKIKYLGASLSDVYQEMLMYGYDEKHYPLIAETLRSIP